MNQWDEAVDFLIVGSGAAAMSAAITAHDLGARVMLVEKSPQYGGSSAMSGGGLWVPNNHLMPKEGFTDSPADAFTYTRGCVGEEVGEARLRAYLDNAPRAVQYLCENTHLRMHIVPDYADYYQDVPGAKEGGRCLEASPFDGRRLSEAEFLEMRETAPQELIMNRISMVISEAQAFLTRSPGWIKLLAKRMAEYLGDFGWRLKSRRDRRCAMGNALIGALRLSLKDRNIPLWLNTPARRIIMENGRVAGVQVEHEGKKRCIRADRGVLLAAGGFDNNAALRERYLPHPTHPDWSCGNPFSTGDALQMGLEAGAGLEFMDEAWWGPTVVVPGEERARMLVIEKSLPGGVLVNKLGKRFVKETAAYNDVVKAMYANHSDTSPCIPAYLVFDANFRRKYPAGPLLPGGQQPDWLVNRDIRKRFIQKADSLEELAMMLGIDPHALSETIARMNGFARSGKDPEFARGENAFDRFYGDKSVTPNPCMAPIEKPPFYGIEVYPGELGTKGGLKVDERARVLTAAGDPIPGLYAAGNCSSPVMGRTYPGAGSTLGPATTFGYVAARDAIAGG
ncbi:MAG: FAD-dependent oxidoreductase [Gammaproteobacteria bacterium]|nr:FAD-dependent oxidoreductase [Gammaproteobacteria bacterium]MBP6053870.1 FAD-dependent oxidoreductase [Pseudomonadales bacterium]MBK6581999.1 FAD-dependent oxidoreductase [Gammaproteobacteria bacterium]MBK7521741.1 FAD-dependent oxidoreductase [Gammaproteobacteria bacterium]MBK7728258.1 FAD-dependent oxidoreductase [Gammaproteobacteria bacterium]